MKESQRGTIPLNKQVWRGDKFGKKLRRHLLSCGKLEGKKQHGWSGNRWEGNIRINLKVTVCGDLDIIHLAQDGVQWRAVVNMVMKLRAPQMAELFLLLASQKWLCSMEFSYNNADIRIFLSHVKFYVHTRLWRPICRVVCYGNSY
jgi:hypothetical protein